MRCLTSGMCPNVGAWAVVGVRPRRPWPGSWRSLRGPDTDLHGTISLEIPVEASTHAGIVHALGRHSRDAGSPGVYASLLDAWSWMTSLLTRSETTWAFSRNC